MKTNIPTEEAMLAFGAKLAVACGDTAVIFLQGPLGAGKTTLARGFLRGLGYVGHVKSPTYTLVEPYDVKQGWVYHFDFYRVNDPEELTFIGIQDYFMPGAICLIEWPDCGGNLLPQADLSCYIDPRHDINLIGHTAHGKKILEQLQDH